MADIYNASPGSQPGEQPKKRNTTLIIILVVVALLLCCCCAFIWVGWKYGDALLQWIDINLNTLVPNLLSTL